jgi:hypothetical protein
MPKRPRKIYDEVGNADYAPDLNEQPHPFGNGYQFGGTEDPNVGFDYYNPVESSGPVSGGGDVSGNESSGPAGGGDGFGIS